VDDLNYLYQRHQLSLIAATASATIEGRAAHRGMARAYGKRIDAMRADLHSPEQAPGMTLSPEAAAY
jgi:hypothetical protein